MAFHVRASKTALAAAFVLGVSGALLVANVRQRAYDGPWIGWFRVDPAPPRLQFFGWPFIAVSQNDHGRGAIVHLKDGDFAGEEAETTSPLWITLPPLIKPW